MDDEHEFFLNKEELNQLLDKCEQMLVHQTETFFDVFEFIELLDFYIEDGKFNKAFVLVNVALKQHPYTPELQFRKAKIHIERNDADSALSILTHLYKIEPENPDILFMMGVAYSIKERFDKAIQIFDAYVDIEGDTEREENYYNIAVSFLNSNEYEYALQYLKKAYALNQYNLLVVYDIAYCFERMAEFKKSIQFYEHYLDLDPYSQNAWYNLGVIYTQCGKFLKAIRAFDYAIAIDDTFSSAFFNKANCLADIEQYSAAIDSYLDFLEFEPDSILAHIYVAECYGKIDDFEQAEAHYSQLLEIDSDCVEGWYGLGIVKFSQHDSNTAMQCLQKAIELDASNDTYWLSYGLVLRDIGTIPAAIGAIKKAIEINQFEVDAWLQLSELYYVDENECAEAILCLKQGRKQAPHYKISYTLAAYCANNHDIIHAKKYFSEAYAENPEESDIFFDICTLQSEILQEFRNIMY